MYVTRPLSHYRKFPETLSIPPEGPNSGYLVIQDEEAETYTCFGLCKNRYLPDLPFPQNKELTICYTTGGENSTTYHDDVVLIPALNQRLSSNCYYAIKPHGKHKGEAFTCSREEDKRTCCFFRCVRDVKPRPFDPLNVYQQFQIERHETMCSSSVGNFHAKSLASDGFPPGFLRRKHWNLRSKTPKKYQLHEATGLNASLREVFPGFNPPEPLVIGKWYTPFMFVKEEGTLRDQIERSLFYEITLERKWNKIFSCQNQSNKRNEQNSVVVDVVSKTENVYVSGNKAVQDNNKAVDGVVWFRDEARSVGLRVEIVERMKWEQERGGWNSGNENKQVRIERVEEFGDGVDKTWSEFNCFVLIESFAVKRNDGSLVMSYDFVHTHQIKSKWE